MLLSPVERLGGGATILFVSASERGLDVVVAERAESIDRSLGVESRGGFLGTGGGGGLRFRLEEAVDDAAMDARLAAGLGSCVEKSGFREGAGMMCTFGEEVWVLVEAFLVEGLRVPSAAEVALGSWYDNGRETVTQSGSGLGVKGFGGL